MPWEEESPLSAALGFAANYYGSQQQEKVRQQQAAQQQQQQALEMQMRMAQLANAQAEAQTRQQEADAKHRADQAAGGINPDTGQPFVIPPALQRIMPGKVGTRYQPTPDDIAKHDFAYAQWLAQTGQKPAADVKRAEASAEESATTRQAQANLDALRGPLIQAQTVEARDRPGLAEQRISAGLAEHQSGAADAEARAAAAQANAWGRLYQSEHFQQGQQARGSALTTGREQGLTDQKDLDNATMGLQRRFEANPAQTPIRVRNDLLQYYPARVVQKLEPQIQKLFGSKGFGNP